MLSKKSILYLSVTAFCLAVITVIYSRITPLDPIHFSVSTGTFDQFLDSSTKIRMLKRIANTPYVLVAAAVSSNQLNEDNDGSHIFNNHDHVMIINTDTSMVILQIDYSTYNASGDVWFRHDESVYWETVLNSNGEPLLVANILCSSGTTKLNNYIPEKYSEKYLNSSSEWKQFFTLEGKFVKFSLPFKSYMIEGTNHVLIPDFKMGTMVEHSVINHELVLENEWVIPTSEFDIAFITPLRNHHYLMFDFQNRRYNFFRFSKKESSRFFTKPELDGLLSVNRVPNQYGIYKIKSADFSDQPELIKFSADGKTINICAVHEEQIEKGELKDIFELLGVEIQMTPDMVLENNNVLIEMKQLNVNHKPKLYYLKREMDDNGKLIWLETVPTEIQLPDYIERVSRYPYDDTHILMYGNNALWTMKYDGTELQQIFPKVD